MTQLFAVPDLRAIYQALYLRLSWPEAIPRPDEVTFRWSGRMTSTFGICDPNAKIITIKAIYQHPRLRGELGDLMAHEASHFIWDGHPKAFKDFLQSAGVAAQYRNGTTRASEAHKAVEAEWVRQMLEVSTRASSPYPFLDNDKTPRADYARPVRAPSGL